jgi:hypothetical protein
LPCPGKDYSWSFSRAPLFDSYAFHLRTQPNDKSEFADLRVTADEFATLIRQKFYVLHRESADFGRAMAPVLHPYITGKPHRRGGLSGLDAMS